MRNTKIFKSDEFLVDLSRDVLSDIRLREYLNECGGNVGESVRLYIWNKAVSLHPTV